MKMQLIPEWKSIHKFWSVRFAGATAALAGMEWLLPSLVDSVPKWAYVLLAVLIALSRAVKQNGVPNASNPASPDEK